MTQQEEFKLSITLINNGGGFTAYLSRYPHLIEQGETEYQAMNNLAMLIETTLDNAFKP